MNIYLLKHEFTPEGKDPYAALRLLNQNDWERHLRSFRTAEPLTSSWPKIAVERLDEGKKSTGLELGDFPWLTSIAPIFSRRAVDGLRDILEPYGELLPLESCDGEFLAYHVTTCIEAIDLEHSDVRRFANGRVMRIIKYSFVRESINGIDVFRTPLPSPFDVFVSDAFRKRVEETDLKGFDFHWLWTDDRAR